MISTGGSRAARSTTPSWIAFAAVLAGVLALAAGSAQAAFSVRLASMTSSGAPANANSRATVPTAISRDGKRVVFESAAANLPGGGGATQVYVRDFASGKTRLVSRDNDGVPSAGGLEAQGISAGGRYAAFQGTGAGLPGANGERQVWVHDLKRRRTLLASRAPGGAPGNGDSGDAALSADGTRVAFNSQAANLPGGDGVKRLVYVRDLASGKTSLVSRRSNGQLATGDLYGQTISADGRRVVFYSTDPGLPGGDGATAHVYVRDLATKKTILADRNRAGEKANASSYNASISGDGRRVVFESQATNLPGQTGNQIYVRDLRRGRTLLAGRNSAGQPQDGYAEFAHLSGNGRYVQFVTDADNLPGGSGAGHSLVYARDLRSGKTQLVSKTALGDRADADSSQGSISPDGRWVVFDSAASNLGGNAVRNVFRVGPLG